MFSVNIMLLVLSLVVLVLSLVVVSLVIDVVRLSKRVHSLTSGLSSDVSDGGVCCES